MFDFENLDVYKVAKELNYDIYKFLKSKKIDIFLYNQIRRASISMVINIAEGSGRFTNKDKRNFFIIARSSVYECVSIFEILLIESEIEPEEYKSYYSKLESVSKMLFKLIKHLEK